MRLRSLLYTRIYRYTCIATMPDRLRREQHTVSKRARGGGGATHKRQTMPPAAMDPSDSRISFETRLGMVGGGRRPAAAGGAGRESCVRAVQDADAGGQEESKYMARRTLVRQRSRARCMA